MLISRQLIENVLGALGGADKAYDDGKRALDRAIGEYDQAVFAHGVDRCQ
jgi:hypothetical protein